MPHIIIAHSIVEFYNLERRHFLVREVNGRYELRELEPDIAHGLSQYGFPTGEFTTPADQIYSVHSIHWTFYFLHSQISRERADEVAAELTQQFLNNQN